MYVAGDEPKQKFLDSSTARLLIVGGRYYRDYLRATLDGSRAHVSKYVMMEIRRGYLGVAVNFYFWASEPTFVTLGEAMEHWSDTFRSREAKTTIEIIGELVDMQRFRLDDPADKSGALREIARHIIEVDRAMRQLLTDCGRDSCRCAMAAIPFSVRPDNTHADLEKWKSEFGDVKACRNRCRIDHFLSERYRD